MNVTVSWTLPSVSAAQYPLASTEVSFRTDPSFPWTVQDNVLVSEPQELVFVDMAPGTYYFQGVCVDEQGQRSDPVEAQVDVPFDRPSAPENFQAVLS